MEVQLERQRPQKETQRVKRLNGEVAIQAEKMKPRVRSTWQKEKTKASRELCLDKIREKFATERMRERQQKTVSTTEKRSYTVERLRRVKDKTKMNGCLYYDVAELQNIIRQSCKERLHLERHLARATEAAHRTSQVDVTEYQTLQKSNEILRQKLEELHKAASDLQDAEVRLGDKESELEELRAELKNRREICADLEHQLHATLEKQEETEKHSLELEKELQRLQPIDEECKELRDSLSTVENRYELAKSEVNNLQNKVNNLEALVKHMKETADKRKELEKQHADTVAELQKKQEEVRHLHYTNKAEKQKALETIQNLESKVRELHKKCELQNVLHEELVLEMASLRRSQVKQAWRSHRSHSADMPTEPSRLDQEMDLYLVGSDTIFSSKQSHNLSTSLPALDTSTPRSLTASIEPFSSLPTTSSGLSLAVTPVTTVSTSSASSTVLNSTSHEIDRILARIEQDNRILAELERSRATVGSPVSTANIERLKAQFEEGQKQLEEITNRTNMKTSVTMRELDILMAKLEQDNRILAELDRKRATIGMTSIFTLSSQTLYTGNRRPFSATPPGSSRSSTPLTGTSASLGAGVSPAIGSGSYSSTLPTLPAGAPYSLSTSHRREEDLYEDVDYIDLPHRGRCKVFIARYSYDPLKQSPNENPEAELCLNAGDYVLIFGEMDEDGFFSGELLDGRKGLVPSNFVEKLTGEELFEFQSQVLYGNRDSDDSSASFTYNDEYGDDMHMFGPKVSLEDYHRMNDYIDLEDIEELDEDDLSDLEREEGPVPPPQRLILERQLNKSILIGWLPPDAPRGSVEAYHVYVDGVPKATIRASEKTRSLVEGVDSNQPHRISVRSVNPSGRHSRDAACTIVIGKDLPLAPSCVKASNVTSTSAVISWLPSNSNFQHVVAINSVEVKALKPGVFRHTITGLAPNTTYKVSVRARPARLFFNNENPKKLGMLTATVEFRTLPKGLPDPPVDIQVEPGPQDGTLLVTWLPVTINVKGTSNGTPVTGYAVYAGDRKISEIDSPTGDHALLDMAQLAPLKKRTVTVRTKAGDCVSTDSMPCVIPLELLKGVAATMMQSEAEAPPNVANEEGEREKDRERPPRERKRSTGSSDSESDTELAELLKHVARRSEAFDPGENTTFGEQGARVEDLLEEGIRSELSDIAEEPEEDVLHSERSERRSQQIKESRAAQREQDLRTERISDRRDERRDERRDDRRDNRRDDRLDRIDDRRDMRRDDRRGDRLDDRYDMRRDDMRDDRIDRIDDRRDIRRDDRRDDRRDSRRDPYDYERREQDPIRTTKNYSRPSDPRSQDRQHGRVSPPSGHRDMSSRERSYGNRVIPDGPVSQRRINSIAAERRDSAGQLIIEPDENLSDKEIYPQPRHVIPAIEITRDNEVINVEDDYMRSNRRGHYAEPPKPRNPSSHYYRGERDGPRSVSPTPPSRYHRDQESGYYGHRGHTRSSRDDYHGNGYREHGSHRSRQSDMDNRPRFFMALYDYDPQTMSPNPDAAEDELFFHEGDIIKQVYGEKDQDGFFRGEVNGRTGLVPYNMVSEVQVDDEETERHLLNKNVSSRHRHSSDPKDPWSTLPVRRLVAMYDYDPQKLSPNVDAEMELPFKTGDIIYVFGDVDEDGFFMGELNNGVRGLVPSNFLTEAPPDFTPRTDRLGPPARGSSGSYSKEHAESSQYSRESRSGGYSSSSAPRDYMPSDKRRYSERPNTERSGNYERSGGHTSERDRGHYSSSGRSNQHW